MAATATAAGSPSPSIPQERPNPREAPGSGGNGGRGAGGEGGASGSKPASSALASSSVSALPADNASAETLEAEHVHAVYEAIAPHFSSTRHKPWPRVARFLSDRSPGSIGLDVGCGNGKYLRVNPAVHILGSDRSAALVRLAQAAGQPPSTAADSPVAGAATASSDVDVAVADGLALPYRPAAVDFVISIAVVHHMSTPDRRRAAISALLDCVRPGDGRVLVYAWALEQASSRRGWNEGSDQDTLVPWVMRTKGAPDETFRRYYHLYREGELEVDVVAAGGTVVESGYERDNWWVICSRPQSSDEQRKA